MIILCLAIQQLKTLILKNRKILFLCGYDYSKVFLELNELEFQVIIPLNEKMLSNEGRYNLQNTLKEKALLLNYEQVAAKIDKLQPDVLISFGWRRIITNNMLNNRKLNINVHPATLPEYKGYHPVPYVLLNNEKEHGITAHIITDELDAGDIVHMEKFNINKFSTLRSLQSKVNDIMPNFIHQLLTKLNADANMTF
jgi:methionyl-tRNA formyltransferase